MHKVMLTSVLHPEEQNPKADGDETPVNEEYPEVSRPVEGHWTRPAYAVLLNSYSVDPAIVG